MSWSEAFRSRDRVRRMFIWLRQSTAVIRPSLFTSKELTYLKTAERTMALARVGSALLMFVLYAASVRVWFGHTNVFVFPGRALALTVPFLLGVSPSRVYWSLSSLPAAAPSPSRSPTRRRPSRPAHQTPSRGSSSPSHTSTASSPRRPPSAARRGTRTFTVPRSSLPAARRCRRLRRCWRIDGVAPQAGPSPHGACHVAGAPFWIHSTVRG